MENKDKPPVNSQFSHPIDVTKKNKKHLNLNFKGFISFKKFTKKPTKKHLIILGIAGVVLVGASILALNIFGPKPAAPNPLPIITSNYEPPKPTTVASPLTGVQVKPELAKRAVTGIMIENSIDARPQSGLRDAGVVFEAIAEGGITRFLALFQEAQPNYIGPIRSARPYYVNWVAGFDAGYVHSGGSPEGLALIRNLGIKDMDHGVYGEQYFDRVSNRYAPHNVYTSMDRLDKLRESKGFNSSDFVGFSRVKEVDSETKKSDSTKNAKASKISFDISGPLYNTEYTYDKKTNSYARTLAGQKHIDEKSGKQIKPDVVIAMIMKYSIHRDGIHSVYEVIGSGSVIVFQNGELIKGTWTKKSAKSNIIFKDKSGKQILLNPGQTWITTIKDGGVSYSP